MRQTDSLMIQPALFREAMKRGKAAQKGRWLFSQRGSILLVFYDALLPTEIQCCHLCGKERTIFYRGGCPLVPFYYASRTGRSYLMLYRPERDRQPRTP